MAEVVVLMFAGVFAISLAYLLLGIYRKLGQLLSMFASTAIRLDKRVEELVRTIDTLTGENIDEVPIKDIIMETYRRKEVIQDLLSSLEITVANGVSRALSKK